MLRAILRSLRTGVVTTRYPDVASTPPEGFRGGLELRPGALFASLPPAEVCPVGAISSGPPAEGNEGRYAIDVGRCVFCGICAAPQPNGAESAIEMGREFELAAKRRSDLVVEIDDDHGRAVWERGAAEAATSASDAVAATIRRTLGRSLHLRHLDAGSCNGCDWELAALLNPVYDVRRLGIDFVASPRHADGVIVTGPVTRNLELAVRRTWEAVPEPRLVIAVGACACSGGIAGQSYASLGGVAEILPVDVFIPGCPPRPEAIIFGILTALGRRMGRVT
jgi:Ni,Fe-hydrogenase III small subunit/formate hydrogenlyase subunit 6/NADH:ubiquinone oxidoreductase subunit I